MASLRLLAASLPADSLALSSEFNSPTISPQSTRDSQRRPRSLALAQRPAAASAGFRHRKRALVGRAQTALKLNFQRA